MNPASPTARAIVIGADRGEQVSIHVTRREFPEASDCNQKLFLQLPSSEQTAESGKRHSSFSSPW